MKFRSVVPHEPLPMEDVGYLHIQGAFEPRRNEKNVSSGVFFWKKDALEQAFLENTVVKAPSAVHVLDHAPPYTKARLQYDSTQVARHVLGSWKQVTPATLFQSVPLLDEFAAYHFGTRPIQVTQVTSTPLPEPSWPRSNPPKFRRLLARPGEDLAVLERERAQTRFVFMTGLFESNECGWSDVHVAMEAIRNVVNTYDSTGLGVEVFLSNKKAIYSCHVGMRTPEDAKKLITNLQGQRVEWPGGGETKMTSGKLFLDYADITQRSLARVQNAPKGEPTKSECTSVTASVVVPGLILVQDFVSQAEEQVLMAVLTGPQAPWAPPQTTPSESGNVKRRVQHYGYVFDYKTANVLRDRTQDGADCPPMPACSNDDDMTDLDAQIATSVRQGNGWEALAGIIERTRRHNFASDPDSSNLCFSELNQMTVNEYKEKSGIGSHVDTPSAFGDGLISISLNSGIVMEFRNTVEPMRKLVYLPRRSLLLMSGPARFSWEHMIVSRMTDTHDGKVIPRGRRVSLTLRTALELPSKGAVPLERVESNVFPPTWGTGSRNESTNNTGDAATTEALVTPSTERDHVHAVYDAIATQWHHTRGKRGVLWPGATQFLTQLPRGSIVADVGCGDGKYFPAIWEAGSYVIGTDISLPLLKTCVGASSDEQVPDSRRVSDERSHLRDRPAVAVADCMNVPLRDKSCDAAICIAVMHHLSTEARRIRCIQELARIVRPGGTINIQTWAMEQDEGSRRKFATNDVFVPFNAQPKYLDKASGESSGASVAHMYSDAYEGAEFDERKGLVVFQRYCHLYGQGELEDLVSRVPSVEVLESGYESGNYFVILRVVN